MLRSRDEFMMHAAHELRAPLAKLKASVEMLAESFQEKNWEQMYSMIGIMQRTVIMFQFFVENLIDVGNYQAGHFRVRLSQVEFKRVIDSALGQFQPIVKTEWQQIDLRLSLPSPCPVMADTTRIAQVIFNLLSNAIKYGVGIGNCPGNYRAAWGGDCRSVSGWRRNNILV
jgi:two-component system sensor histidine kinase ChiS